jgi:hypothetical protein
MPATRDEDDRTDPGRSDKHEGWVQALTAAAGTGAPEFSFDFDAFERSEAEAARPLSATLVPAPAARAPERRAIVPRNWLPPGDSVVETRPVGNMTVVSLRGRINESFRGAELGQSLRGVVVFDLAQVDRISSFGVKGWLQMMEHARFTSAYFFRCSEAVINQITMMRNFCGAGRIHSLLVPYQCAACGEEFSAVYEAVGDRELILGRSPVPVECPRCASAAKMADDPWAYLSLDEHLLDDVPADLEQVLEHLTIAQRVDPIEKFVSDDETRIRINAPLDARLRLTRALTGLEGRVVFDLTPQPEIGAAGIQRLTEAIRELDPEVTEVWIDGATHAVIEALLIDPPPRTFVSTAWVTAVASATGLRRPVLVDVRKKRSALLRGELPVLEGGRGPSTYEDAEIVFEAARHLVPAQPVARTPTPAPAPVRFQATPVPAPGNTEARLQQLQLQQMQLQQMQQQLQSPNTGPAPVVRAAAPVGMSVPIWQIVAWGMVTLGMAALAFVIVFLAVARNFITQRAAAPAPVPPPAISAPASAELGWDGGSPLPPAWTEQPVVADDSGVKAVGIARGDTAEYAAEKSKYIAVYRLVQHVSDRLATEPVAASFGADPGDDAAEDVAQRFLADVGAWATPVRVNQAVKRETAGFKVATQHSLDAATLERVVAHYRETFEFRGLTVARRFPYRPGEGSEVIVVSADTWFKGVAPGDQVVQVGRDNVSTFEEFVKAAPAAFKDVPDGQSMVILVDHEGKRSKLEFTRAASTGPKKDPKIDLLPLEPTQ